MGSFKRKIATIYTVGLTERQVKWVDSMFLKQGWTAVHASGIIELIQIVREAKPDFVLAAEPEFTEGAVRAALSDHSIEVKSMRFPRLDHDVFDDDVDPPGLGAVLTPFDLLPSLDDSEPWNKRPI
ncbi:MAG: hypothetical protein M3R13_08670 [Armatimonadota bacterium]|nr:hypothetical protein [Armatimonadota bacterium]